MKKASLFASAAVVAAARPGATRLRSLHRAPVALSQTSQSITGPISRSITLQKAGIVIGYPDGTFGGKRAMTRYEFAVAIARMLDIVNKIPLSICRTTSRRKISRRPSPLCTEERSRCSGAEGSDRYRRTAPTDRRVSYGTDDARCRCRSPQAAARRSRRSRQCDRSGAEACQSFRHHQHHGPRQQHV